MNENKYLKILGTKATVMHPVTKVAKKVDKKEVRKYVQKGWIHMTQKKNQLRKEEAPATDINEAFSKWTITVVKPINKLKKGDKVTVSARGTAEALKKAAKAFKDPNLRFTVPVLGFGKISASTNCLTLFTPTVDIITHSEVSVQLLSVISTAYSPFADAV